MKPYHPDWYYDLYDVIFNWNRNNNIIIVIINQNRQINNSTVEEIGSGKGDFIESLLSYSPLHVICTDIDERSIVILKKRFENLSSTIEIFHQDGNSLTNKKRRTHRYHNFQIKQLIKTT
jgi:16S rRNA A1518/A1519 N6-dimethyltransferase RsmA/KsgA/DIM1 with predicted DNA glycosylase/AP lyase activity